MTKRPHLLRSAALLAVLILSYWAPDAAHAQRRRTTAEAPPPPAITTPPAPAFEEGLYQSVQWRHLGPFRGGRSAAVAGVPGQPNLYYFGATGGGVWRTRDGGQTWACISDGHFGGSIGAVAVAEDDPNVIYVGGGEKTVRGNVSYGYGVWKSQDAGQTWQHVGLPNSRHIPRIRIHPRNADLVYAAVLGDLFKPGDERGVYRSKDGGKNWERVLFANADAGAVDLAFDPTNPRILYASTWRIRRTPYSLESGGPGSALWKSADGGDTWTEISQNKGFPKGALGIIGVAPSPVQQGRVWAIVEAEEGGVYRSDDGGASWQKLNDDRALRQRAWYYTRIYADTKEADGVYVVNVSYHKSTDGGRTFKAYNAPHGDHHDLWIAPEDNRRMIIADDGGAQVSTDGGDNWTTYHNQPTAQFYRVITDDHFPYRIYGAQQDNSTLRILHRTDGAAITERDWEPTAGGESGHIAVDPTDNDVVYGGSYGGFLTRYNHRTRQRQAVNVWPDNPMGHGAEGMKYRFQWNFPIFFSPHDPKRLYAASNHLHVTTDGGQSWQIISPDLTRNDSTKLGPSGGPITKDNTSVEYYCTLFAALESPYEAGLLWAGSDDGLLHVSRNGGQDWANVTPPQMPEWAMINSLEADPFTKGGLYVAATRYKLGDYRPYLYKTEDYGRTWRVITTGIPNDHFTRVLRADPARRGLLYAGTETGMYLSFDDGASWRPFQLNLPIVPITDLTVKGHHLIAATQGRSFWMIDDLGPLRQLEPTLAKQPAILYRPADTHRMGGGQRHNPLTEGTNHPAGAMIHFHLRELPADKGAVTLGFYDGQGQLIREYSTTAKEKADQLEVKAGANLFVWDLHYPNAKGFEGIVLWAASLRGPRAVPGQYKVRLAAGGQVLEQPLTILKDPRADASQADLQAQFDFVRGVQAKVSEAHTAIADIRDLRGQLQAYQKRIEGNDAPNIQALMEKAKAMTEAVTAIEETLYQTKNRSGQDPLNFPIRLTNKLASVAALAAYGDNAPTAQSLAVRNELVPLIDAELARWARIKAQEVPAFNQMAKAAGVDAVFVK